MADKLFRLGVISDTHGDTASIRRAAIRLSDVDAVAFLGDVVTDLPTVISTFGKPLYAVRGNCDMYASEPVETVIELQGKRLLLTHGHHYHVKSSLLMLEYRAIELRCDAALFGHTHMPYSSYDGGVLLFNPGATSAAKGTCGVLEFRENGLCPLIYEI